MDLDEDGLGVAVQSWWTTLPETNSEFTPENGWLEYKPFLLGCEILVSGRVYHVTRWCLPRKTDPVIYGLYKFGLGLVAQDAIVTNEGLGWDSLLEMDKSWWSLLLGADQ